MADLVDRLGAALLDASLAATAISGFAVVAYLVGLSIGLGLLALGVWGASLLINRSVLPSDSSTAISAALAYGSWPPRPRLRVSPRAGRPVLLGIVRPAILIPPELDEP